MQVRLAGVASRADARQRLSSPHTVPDLHAQTARLQVHVVCKLTATKVESDRVSRNCFNRNGYSGVERLTMPGDIVRKTISCRDHTAIGDRKNGPPIGKIRAHIPRVAGERRTVLDLLPVDCVAS